MMSKTEAAEKFDIKENCVPERAVRVRKRRCYAILVIGVLSILLLAN
jgi:hypothetical protein